jgi:hypothetical protein
VRDQFLFLLTFLLQTVPSFLPGQLTLDRIFIPGAFDGQSTQFDGIGGDAKGGDPVSRDGGTSRLVSVDT